MIYSDFFARILKNAKKNGIYREFNNISRICGKFPKAINNKNNKEITIWCSNDYLSLGQNQMTINNAINSLNNFGLGSGGTRNISGNSSEIVQLEKDLSNLHDKDSSLLFTSGYIANEATISSLAKIIPNLIIFSDEENHASIIAGIKNSGLKKYVFRHNDINHLEELLKEHDIGHPKLIIFESVYSMSGDFGKINEICQLAKEYHAMTMLDEVHAVALYGKNGAGRASQLRLDCDIDIIQGTLAKGFGVIGGYISSDNDVIDAIRSVAPPFIFTTAMPPVIARASSDNIYMVRNNPDLMKDFHDNVSKTKRILEEYGVAIKESESHIIPLIIGDAQRAKDISCILLEEYNIYLQNISYPTVKEGEDMLRITPNRLHNEEMIYDLAKSLKNIL
ncbi:5-aminolevulinate synthase [Rickettsiales bacterium]|nr:5-aminolevulinate synthase [Rickettsiales bacterium]